HAGIATKHPRQMKRRAVNTLRERAERPVLRGFGDQRNLRRLDDFLMARSRSRAFVWYGQSIHMRCAEGADEQLQRCLVSLQPASKPVRQPITQRFAGDDQLRAERRMGSSEAWLVTFRRRFAMRG